MYNGDPSDPDENEDLYTLYCDLYDTARNWLAQPVPGCTSTTCWPASPS